MAQTASGPVQCVSHRQQNQSRAPIPGLSVQVLNGEDKIGKQKMRKE